MGFCSIFLVLGVKAYLLMFNDSIARQIIPASRVMENAKRKSSNCSFVHFSIDHMSFRMSLS